MLCEFSPGTHPLWLRCARIAHSGKQTKGQVLCAQRASDMEIKMKRVSHMPVTLDNRRRRVNVGVVFDSNDNLQQEK